MRSLEDFRLARMNATKAACHDKKKGKEGQYICISQWCFIFCVGEINNPAVALKLWLRVLWCINCGEGLKEY